MSLSNDLSPADIRACTEGNSGGSGWGGFGGDGAWWIIILFLFAFVSGGWGNGGLFGGGGNSGAANNYVLASDFATIQRQLSDGFNAQERRTDAIVNGLCSIGYDNLAQANGINTNIMQTGYGITNAINGIGTQLADCCCKTQSGIERINTGVAMASGDIKAAIKDCCCDTEKQFMQSRFDSAQYNCNTLQAIDKLGDRIIDYMAQDKAQALRDENQALRLAASQAAQNNYIISSLRPYPVPSFSVPNPFAYNGGCPGC